MHREATEHEGREKTVTRRSPFSLLVFRDKPTLNHVSPKPLMRCN